MEGAGEPLPHAALVAVLALQNQGDAKDDAQFDKSTKAQQQGDEQWLACAGRAVKAATFYPRLEREAQDLVDRMAGR